MDRWMGAMLTVAHGGLHSNLHIVCNMDGMQLISVSDEKDLRIIVSENLKWEKQCSDLVHFARVLGMIKRNFVSISKETTWYVNIVRGLVRPHLEYCCQIWASHFNWH